MNPSPRISPLNPTLRPGQELALEVLGMSNVDWSLSHSPLEGGLQLLATHGWHTSIRVPRGMVEGGIYFLRATNRQDPRQTAVTTLRVLAPEDSSVPYRRHQVSPGAGGRPSPWSASRPTPGFLAGLRGLLARVPARA